MTDELIINAEHNVSEGKPVNRVRKYIDEYSVPFLYEGATPEDVCADARKVFESGAVYTDDELESIREFIDILTTDSKHFRNIADVMEDLAVDMSVRLAERELEERWTPAMVAAKTHAYIESKRQAIREHPTDYVFDGGMPTVDDVYRDCSRILDSYGCTDLESLTRAYFEIDNLTAQERDFIHMRAYHGTVVGRDSEYDKKIARVGARLKAFESIGDIMVGYLRERENVRAAAIEETRKKIDDN